MFVVSFILVIDESRNANELICILSLAAETISTWNLGFIILV